MRQAVPNNKLKETAEKLNKILTQNQTSEAAKGQTREVSSQRKM